jgi:serine protease SohB
VSEFFAEYGLFLAELATLVVLVLIVIGLIASRRGGAPEGITVENLNRRLEDAADALKSAMAGKARGKKEAKARRKERKREERSRAKEDGQRPRLFVVDFKGDLRASASASLREEVTAILGVAADQDQVLLRLENPGGAVHEHGFAASQLLRLKRRGLRLTVAVDKVAASGGYLMACVGDHVIAAPFAVVGSIGVIAQLPNFHRLLEEKGVDYEQLTAGRFKRTLTMFGKNTEEGRAKLQQEIEEVHELFKQQIREHRPRVDIERVGTGEHWYGLRALELELVDEIKTSDDFLVEAAQARDVYKISYRRKRPLSERLLGGAETLLSH